MGVDGGGSVKRAERTRQMDEKKEDGWIDYLRLFLTTNQIQSETDRGF